MQKTGSKTKHLPVTILMIVGGFVWALSPIYDAFNPARLTLRILNIASLVCAECQQHDLERAWSLEGWAGTSLGMN